MIILGISGATILTLQLIHPGLPVQTQDATNTGTLSSPADQNKKGDEALKAALIALNGGDVDSAKKQLDLARSYYESANNEQGVANVDANYLILTAIPKKPLPSQAATGI